MIDFLPFVLLKTNINLQNMPYCLELLHIDSNTGCVIQREIQDAFAESAAFPSTMALLHDRAPRQLF